MQKELELAKMVSAYNILEGGEDIKNSIKNLDLKFKGKTAFKLSLLKNRLKEFIIIHDETRDSLIKNKYGLSEENGGYSIPNNMFNSFMSEYNEILQYKYVINFEPLTMEDIEDLALPIEFTDIFFDFFE